MELDNNLSKELFKVNKHNLMNIEKFLTFYTSRLSPNHVFLLQLKVWLIEGLGRLPYGNSGIKLTPENMKRKIKLIREILKGMDKFESCQSYLRGVLCLELGATIVEQLIGMFSDAKKEYQEPLDPIVLVQEAQQCADIAEMVFKHEDPKSPDGTLKMKVCDLKVALLNFC
jgi:hypothetical protein